MKEKMSASAPVTDKEILEKVFSYFSFLRRSVPSMRLNDVCSGILALTHELLLYLEKNDLIDYGDN